MKELSAHEFPPPYGKSPSSKLNYVPVLSGEWQHLKTDVIDALKEHVNFMSQYGYKNTPEGEEFIRELSDYAKEYGSPPPEEGR